MVATLGLTTFCVHADEWKKIGGDWKTDSNSANNTQPTGSVALGRNPPAVGTFEVRSSGDAGVINSLQMLARSGETVTLTLQHDLTV